MPLGPSQGYLANFNTFTLPGYVQNEQFDSTMNIAQHYAPFADGSLSEQTGLQNKLLSLTLKVWEPTYLDCKNEVQRAATILRTKKSGFAPLYVQYTDRYYEAITQKVTMDKTAGTSVRILEYQVQFEAKPYSTSTSGYLLTGTSTNTDTVGRTIADGGWTPTIITVTGTDVTVSGFTSTGDFAGFISVSGAVTNMIINTNDFTATIGGINANDRMRWADYRVYVGPAKTSFVSTGASSMTVRWNNRWYL